jgi:hypothetical protein
MASTIKLKNGSGAPTTGDLVQGEPALDLTNKRLYTENASGVVIEVGVNPTSITTGNITANGTINLTGATVSNAGSITTADINGGTIDGTVIGGSSAAAVTGTTITGTSFVSSGDMTFEDNDKAVFGDGSDLRIYHTGSHSTIENIGTGHLQIHTTDFRLRNSAGTESMILANADGNVQLFYDNAEKLATTATGIDVTGTVTADGLTSDGNVSVVGAGNTRTIGFDFYGSPKYNFHVDGATDADKMFIRRGTTNVANFASNGDISFYEDTGTTAKFFWDASEERLGIGTTSPSVHLDVEGTAQVNLLDVTHDGDRAVNFVKTGANTFSIEHDVNQFYFWNQTTSESPLLFQNDGDVIMNGGNVGIGTSSPSRKVSLADSVNGYNLELQQTSAYNSGNQSGIVFSAPYNIGGSVTDLASIRGGKENATDEDFGGKLAFYTRANGGSDTERMRIDSSGNVGIGVVPSSWASNTFDALQLGVGIGVGNLTARVDGINAVGLGLNWYYGGGATNTYVASSFATNYVQEAGTHKWLHAASGTAGAALTFTESMRIDSSGNVGIGTTTPNSAGLGANGQTLQLGTRTFIATDSSGDTRLGGLSGSNFTAFYSGGTERMRISSGNLLVGTTTLADVNGLVTNHLFEGANSTAGDGAVGVYNNTGTASSPALVVLNRDSSTDSSNRFVQFYANVTSSTAQSMGGIVGNGVDNVQFASISDVREKTNIESINGSLNKIKALNPVEFDWITSGEHCKAGFIAQEVEKVFPEFVVENMSSEGQEERKGLTGGMTGGIVAHLVKAIQEQNELINDLRARVAQLEGAN